ncbi:hypothetical protein DL546_005678 [Coniochaeta pulveracea]|uniref:Mitochondrial import inner membrane translocase subunit TIM50 n=1 Tax=Coniochaeta pulveracea TaxID=177199 RepID=A0A420Y249_9PEZI|nr:hypothetical protein DL546_005678 [Coniochaeta pulveracea]
MLMLLRRGLHHYRLKRPVNIDSEVSRCLLSPASSRYSGEEGRSTWRQRTPQPTLRMGSLQHQVQFQATGQQDEGMNRKARRHARKAAQEAAPEAPGTYPVVFDPSVPAFASSFNQSPWDAFPISTQHPNHFFTAPHQTPFWPTPAHHRIDVPPPNSFHYPGTAHQMASHPPPGGPPPRKQEQQPWVQKQGQQKSGARQPKSKPQSPKSPTKRKDLAERDTIVPPSAASGGIPEPSPTYLLRASFLPITTTHPHPLLIVIDLNGTLLYRPDRRKPHSFISRPHAREFLSYCLDTFSVMIWSSARMTNVTAMVNSLFTPEQMKRVLAVWGREHFGLTPGDYNARVQCYKRLERVWADEGIQRGYSSDWQDDPNGAPGTGLKRGRGKWDQGNTVLIDDSAEKARSEPYNAIQIPEFLGSEKKAENVLPQVHDYINILACQADVSTYMRVNPFKVQG